MWKTKERMPKQPLPVLRGGLWVVLVLLAFFSLPGRTASAGRPDTPDRQNVLPVQTRAERLQQLLRANPQARVARDGTVFLSKTPPLQDLSIRLLNIDAADTTNADQLWSGGGLGLSLSGLNVTVGIWDGGQVRSTHQELTGRVTLVDGGSISNHSTHVAGTIGATGAVANAHGMANQVLLRSRDYLNDVPEMITDAGIIDLSNHSYGNLRGWTTRISWDGLPDGTDTWFADRALFSEDPFFGKYEQTANVLDLAFGAAYQIANARDLDDLLYTYPQLLAVWSAGNDRGDSFTNALGTNQYVTYRSDGPGGAGFYLVTSSGSLTAPDPDGGATGFDSLPQTQVAKNNLVVGALYDVTADPYTTGDVTLVSFSSFGPADDGRVKPDVVANGVSLLSSIGTANNAYAYYSGTSMSSPNTCGTMALLLEHYRDLNGGASPTSATLKALVIHTAFDAGTTGPDYKYGWGVVDAAAAAAFLDDSESASPNLHHFFDETYTGTTQDIVVDSDGTEPLAATVVWTDPPPTVLPGGGLDDDTPVLVNDLDLSVIGPPGSTTYFPWTLDAANPSAAAVRTARNEVDNVEQVRLDAPSAGAYTVRISHTGGSFTQTYSLLISGVTVPDCNENSVPDNQDIAAGTSKDCNADDIPDECEAMSLRADLDADGDVDGWDFMEFSKCFNGSLKPPKDTCVYPCADFDGDDDVDGEDFLDFSQCFNGSLRPPKCP